MPASAWKTFAPIVKKPGENHGWAFVSPHCCSSSWSAVDDLDALLERVHADRVARPARADRERAVAAVRALAVDDDRAGSRRRRRPARRQRPRVRGRLGHDRAVGAEARLDRPPVVPSGCSIISSPITEWSCSSPREPHALVLERLRDRPHRGARALHVGRAEPVEAAVPDLGVPRAAARASRPGSTGATVSTCAFRTSERPPPAPRAHADEVPALRILRDPVRLEPGLPVAAARGSRSRGSPRRSRPCAHDPRAASASSSSRATSSWSSATVSSLERVDPGEDALAGAPSDRLRPAARERPVRGERHAQRRAAPARPCPFDGLAPLLDALHELLDLGTPRVDRVEQHDLRLAARSGRGAARARSDRPRRCCLRPRPGAARNEYSATPLLADDADACSRTGSSPASPCSPRRLPGRASYSTIATHVGRVRGVRGADRPGVDAFAASRAASSSGRSRAPSGRQAARPTGSRPRTSRPSRPGGRAGRR